MRISTFVPRFVRPADLAELSNLWHLSRTAIPYSLEQGTANTRYRRVIWASVQFAKSHPEVSATAAYKDLDDMLNFGGR